MTAIAIINRHSGTALNHEPAALEAAIRSALDAAGLQAELQIVAGNELEEALQNAASSSAELLIIAGGDGTINAAARAAMKADKTLGILPMGTLNRLPNDLSIPLNLYAAARVIANGKARRIDAAEVNGEPFFCNSFFGLPAIFSEYRNNLRGKPLLRRIHGYFSDFVRTARAAREIEVTVNNNGSERVIRGMAFAVSNNPYDETQFMALHRGWMDKGLLGFYVSKHKSFGSFAWMLVKVLFGRWNGERHLERFTAKTITISAKRSELKLTNDGELMKMKTPLVYNVIPKALSVMTPHSV